MQTTLEVLQNSFKTELINDPIIKVSHPIKGRIPEAKHKPSKDLLENEKIQRQNSQTSIGRRKSQ